MGAFKDFFGSVTVIPQATVRSFKMAALYYILVLGAVVYVLLELIFYHRYAEFTPSTSFINLWTVSGRSKANEFLNDSFCQNSTFDWILNDKQIESVGPFAMQNLSCKFFTDAQSFQVEHNRVSIATTIFETYENGTIIPTFVTGQQKIVLKMMHNLHLPDGTELKNPPTEIIDHRGKVYMSEDQTSKNSHISLTLADVYAVLGSDLDTFNPQPDGIDGLGIPDPRHRNTGMVVAVRLRYTNTEEMKAGMRPKCRISMSASKGQWGNMGSLAAGDVSLIRMGVTMNFIVEGEIGSPTPYRVVLHFISGFVLLEMARNIVLMAIRLVKCCSKDGREFSELNEIEITSASYKDDHQEAGGETSVVNNNNPLMNGSRSNPAKTASALEDSSMVAVGASSSSNGATPEAPDNAALNVETDIAVENV